MTESISEQQQQSMQQPEENNVGVCKKQKSTTKERVPSASRDTIFASLDSQDVRKVLAIARTFENAVDKRGRITTHALRKAVNTRDDWVEHVRRAHAMATFAQVYGFEPTTEATTTKQ